VNDKRKWTALWVAVGLLLCLNLATIGWIASRVGQIRAIRQNPEQLLSNRLDFSAEQQTRFRELRAQFRQASQPVQDSLKREHAELFRQFAQPVSDAELDLLTAQLERHNRELLRLRFRHWQQVRTLCTPQQQTRFDRMVGRLLNQSLTNNNQ
jgi:periplasmic protein CpxP/Spy